ncbi:hypothetical protein [Streptomyces melanogenes]|uniref:hypothetical protein n=1 Tax=Streptomyces melanogenes TaxID=67326 RepID=UPI00167D9E0F|nr:hypothetical protein [Streptomyces melanogenes]GGP90132.1 hypothetical protein GCM10010278_80730 [Streptomyces melanogenes]
MDFHPTGRPMSDSEAAAEAKRIFDANFRHEQPVRQFPTSFRDDSPVPAYGDTPPVKQDDKRIVPAWAAGIAVASIGVGAGSVGLGCCAWLVLKGLASVTLTGVLMVTLPLAGAAMLATAIGGAISRARSAVATTIYEAPVTHHTQITNNSSTRGMFFARTRNDIHR